MDKKKEYKLDKLPDIFREIFLSTTHRIENNEDVILSADFSFTVNRIMFMAEFVDREKDSLWRKLIDEVFENKEFVDKNLQQLSQNHNTYIQSLYAQGLIYLWTSLECLIKRLIEELIKFDKEILTLEIFRKINIPMTEFFELNDDERFTYLANLIVNNLNCYQRHGVERFECYLSAFGLSGNVKNEDKRNILALQYLRNCIVHNDSRADLRFCKQCGWLGYNVGDVITIKKDEFKAYQRSVLYYMQEIFYRLNKNFGAPGDFLLSLRKKIDDFFGIS